MEVIGILKQKYDTAKVSEKFQKRDFVLTTDVSTPYPQHVLIQLSQDKCSLLDTINEGEELKVQFNLRGREWNGPQGIKYFNTVEAWRIEKTANATPVQQQQQQAPVQQQQTPNPFQSSAPVNNDDLPF